MLSVRFMVAGGGWWVVGKRQVFARHPSPATRHPSCAPVEVRVALVHGGYGGAAYLHRALAERRHAGSVQRGLTHGGSRLQELHRARGSGRSAPVPAALTVAVKVTSGPEVFCVRPTLVCPGGSCTCNDNPAATAFASVQVPVLSDQLIVSP